MSSVLLPVIPPEVARIPHARTGNAARLELGGAPIHVLPELTVAVSLEELEAAPQFEIDDAVPGSAVGDGWRVWAAPDGLEAALQRLFPIDAIGISGDQLIDPLGGQELLGADELNWPSGAQSDPLSGVRAIALAAECRIDLSPACLAEITQHASDVFHADRRLARYWLTRLLCSGRPVQGLRNLQETRLLSYLLPELEVMVGFHLSARHHHKDIWAHTCQVVQQAVPRPLIRWAALLHDIGKVSTRSFTEKGKVHFLRHDDVGAYMFEGIAIRLGFPEVMAERLRLLILHHLRPAMYSGLVGSGSTSIHHQHGARNRRPARPWACRHHIEAEGHSQAGHLQHFCTSPAGRGTSRQRRAEEAAGADRVRRAIIDQLGIVPGPEVGVLRAKCEAAVRAGTLTGNVGIDECIAYLRADSAA